MIESILELDLLDIILKFCEPRFESKIRSNGVLALSLLTYHPEMFDELIKKNVIDLVMGL
jgi:hypothetical protein